MSPQPSSSSSVHGYLAKVGTWRFPPEGPLDAATDWANYPGWKRWLARRFPEERLDAVRVLVTRMHRPLSVRSLRRAATPLRLHLGCGTHHLAGWTNVDLYGTSADVPWDLRHHLPVADGSVTAIFHEHMLEHLPFATAVGFLGECHRLLTDGGVLRIGVPDFHAHAEGYLGTTTMLDDIRPQRPTPLVALNEVMYCYGHASMWDFDLFNMVLGELGFGDIRRRAFGESSLSPAPDWEFRRNGTLYVECVKLAPN